MIFVTVGTHEQQFNRLIKKIDELKEQGTIREPVFIQSGYSTYEPKHCQWRKLLPYKEMEEKIRTAHIVITHGGPSSFISVLQAGKIPVVVPRKAEFGEHVNDHQVDFSRKVYERQKNIILVEDVEKLGEIIADYDQIVSEMPKEMKSNNLEFNRKLEKIVDKLFGNRQGKV